MLSYWLSCYVLPNGPKDSLYAYVFPLPIRLARGDRLALALVYVGLLFYRLNECVHKITRSMGQFLVVTYADTSFLQLFV